MKAIFAVLALVIALPVLAQVQPPRPIPPHIPLPPNTFPRPWPGQDPWGNDPWGDRCFGRDYDRVEAMTRANAENKAESWGTAKGVKCDVTSSGLDSARAMCLNDDGTKFARLTMLMNVTCGPRWGNRSTLRKTKILYY